MSAQESINAYWDQRAETYHRLQQRPDRKNVDREVWGDIMRDALPSHAQRVLDIGTGSGFLAFVHSDVGKQVTGVDLSEQMLEIARHEALNLPEQQRPEFIMADAVEPALTLGERTFDAVTSRYLMWTLRHPVEALKNWRELLVPGGTLIVIDAPWFPRGLDENKTENFAELYDETVRAELPLAEAQSIESTVAVIERAGFIDIQVRELTEVLELDLAQGATPGHQPTLQYLVSATRP